MIRRDLGTGIVVILVIVAFMIAGCIVRDDDCRPTESRACFR